MNRPDFARVLLDHLDECPVCGCPRTTFGVPVEGVCECECRSERWVTDYGFMKTDRG